MVTMANTTTKKDQDQHGHESQTLQGVKGGIQGAKDMAHSAVETLGEGAKSLASSAAEGAKNLASSAAEGARSLASGAANTADSAAAAVGGGVKSVADTVRHYTPHEGMLGAASEAVAGSLDSAGRYLQQEGVTGMADDVSDMIRRYPIPAVLIGVGIGFMLARLAR